MFDARSPFASSTAPSRASRNAVALDRLRQALTACEIAPGASFSEAEASARFGLGRAAVRVALTSLAATGLVDRHPRQGWQAAAISGAVIGEVVAARRNLEPILAQVRLSESEAAFLGSVAQVGAAAAMSMDPRALSTARAADRQLMEALAEKTGSLIARWIGEAWDQSARILHMLDGAGVVLWPCDRRPLIESLLRDDASTARAEIDKDLARLESAAMQALMLSGSPFAQTPVRRSARRRKGKDQQRRERPAHMGEFGP